METKKRLSIHFNSPVVLIFFFASLLILVISILTKGWLGSFLAIRYTSWLDPFMYLRLFTHVLTHQTVDHFAGNMMMILVLGPMVEEKYGSSTLNWMIIVTSLVTGLINIIFFKNVILLGASGIVFMLILLASYVNVRQGSIPLTVILVAVLYLGTEIVNSFIVQDNISRITHIAGGLCGSAFGYVIHKE